MSAPAMTPQSVARTLSPFTCPRCAGEISVREGARLGRCAYCKVSLLARIRGGKLRFVLTPSLDRDAAGDAIRELLHRPEVGRDVRRNATLQALDLLFLPYWRFQATVVGRLQGSRRVKKRPVSPRGDGDYSASSFGQPREVFRTEMVDKPIRKIWQATLSACPTDEMGVPSLSRLRQRSAGMGVTRSLEGLPGLRFFDRSVFRLGTVLDVMLPEATARHQADGLLRQYIQTRGLGVEGRNLRFLKLQERCYLLYYPVYLARFRYRGRVFRISLDGHHGGFIQAHLPVQPRFQLAACLGVALGGALLTAAPLRVLLFPPAGLELGGLLRLWTLWGLMTAGVLLAGRKALSRLRFDSDRMLHG